MNKCVKIENKLRKTNLDVFRPEDFRLLDLRKTNAKPLELWHRHKPDHSETSYTCKLEQKSNARTL